MLLHHIRLQPDTHGVGLHTRALHITHTLNTLQSRNDIDVGIVRQELVIVTTVRGQGIHDHLRRLTFHHRHTHTRYLGRQQGLSL